MPADRSWRCSITMMFARPIASNVRWRSSTNHLITTSSEVGSKRLMPEANASEVIRPPIDHDEIDGAHLRGYCSIWHSSAMMRRQAIIEAGGYRNGFDSAADFDLWLRLAEVGKVANIPKVLLRYRLHEHATSERQLNTQREFALRSCQDAWERRGIAGQFEPVTHWRPGTDRASRHEFALKYGWTAWVHGHRDTWWTYAREALRLRPFALSSWKLLVFGFLKSPPGAAGSVH